MGSASAPLVSVVLPTRNRAATLGAALRSVLEQRHRNIEVIVVDDGSTDDTAEVLSSFDDERVVVVTNDQNLGAARARNVAIERARGDLIAFQDSDDRWVDGHLDHLVTAMGDAPADVALAYGVVQYESGRLAPGPADHARDGDLRRVLVRYNIIGLPACVIRADVLRAVGPFDASMRRLEDWELFLRISAGHRFTFVDKVVVEAGETGERISANVPDYYAALAHVLDRHRELFASAPECQVAYRMQIARFALREGRTADALRQVGASLRAPRGLARWSWDRIARRRSLVDRERSSG